MRLKIRQKALDVLLIGLLVMNLYFLVLIMVGTSQYLAKVSEMVRRASSSGE